MPIQFLTPMTQLPVSDTCDGCFCDGDTCPVNNGTELNNLSLLIQATKRADGDNIWSPLIRLAFELLTER